jgi:hypothetical protein
MSAVACDGEDLTAGFSVHGRHEPAFTAYRNDGVDSPLTIRSTWGNVGPVAGLLFAVVGALRSAFRSKASPVAENLALRQQLAILRRRTKRPRLIALDRAFWIVLSSTWSRWAPSLAIVKPETGDSLAPERIDVLVVKPENAPRGGWHARWRRVCP